MGFKPASLPKGIVQLLRPKQWIKNLFVMAPLMFSGQFLDLASIVSVIQAALLFCIASSATYVLNDIKDRERDRLHPEKSAKRPIASGIVSVRQAQVLLAVLYGILIVSSIYQPKVILVILAYLTLNVGYSLYFKHQPVIDIFTIAVGFVLRVYGGAVAIDVPVSSWMFVTTLCLALYLAAIKRRQELMTSGVASREVLSKYTVSLVDRYAEMSATGALIFYSLFVMTAKPMMVITIPLVLYGLFRYWFVVESHGVGESPTDVVFEDWHLIVTVILWIVVSAIVIWPE